MPNHTSKLSLLLRLAGVPLVMQTKYARVAIRRTDDGFAVNGNPMFATLEAALREAARILAAARPPITADPDEIPSEPFPFDD
jgi:hypothetical protein